jgi:ATP-binding cassette, subfamily B (MDR/TAP), member 1
MGVGSVGSILMGVSIPVFANLTGSIIDSFSTQGNMVEEAKSTMLLFVYLACTAFFVGLVMNLSWHTSAERQAEECRKQYFKSILRQELAWFDTHELTQITTSFAADTLSF